MARFIILKSGQNHSVFEFDGNIARAGTGSNMDIDLPGAGGGGDLFFLTKTPEGYEVEPRCDDLTLMVNGTAVTDRVLLKEGDKVTFADYMIIASYGEGEIPATAKAAATPEVEKSAPSAPTPEVGKKNRETVMLDTIPQKAGDASPASSAAPIVEKPAARSVDTKGPPPEQPPRPPAPPRNRETELLDQSRTPDLPADIPKRSAPPPPSPKSTERYMVSERKAAQRAGKRTIAPVHSLVMLTGYNKGRVYPIDTTEFAVGRDHSCNLVIDRNESGELDKSFSREHFVISSTDDGLYLTDRKSKLRTFLNGTALEPDQREFISPEDEIAVPAPAGEVIFRLCFAGEENFEPPGGGGKSKSVLVMTLSIIVLLMIIVVLILWK